MSKTVKVRIAVAIDETGEWNCFGASGIKDKEMMDIAVEVLKEGERRYWMEAELPVPEIATISAEISDA